MGGMGRVYDHGDGHHGHYGCSGFWISGLGPGFGFLGSASKPHLAFIDNFLNDAFNSEGSRQTRSVPDKHDLVHALNGEVFDMVTSSCIPQIPHAPAVSLLNDYYRLSDRDFGWKTCVHQSNM